jgi:hypothetical protein
MRIYAILPAILSLIGIAGVLNAQTVGVGTDNPKAKLQVFGEAAFEDELFQVSKTTDTVITVTNDGKVGIGITKPAKLLHVAQNNDFGHIRPGAALFRLQNLNNTTCPGTNNNWEFRIGNCGQLGIGTHSANENPNFNIIRASDLVANSDGPVVSLNTTAPVGSFSLGATGDVHVLRNLRIGDFVTPATEQGSISLYGVGTGYQGYIHMRNNVTGLTPSDGGIIGMDGNIFRVTNYENAPLILATNNLSRFIINGDGTIRATAYGAGILTTDASGNFTASSTIPGSVISSNISHGAAFLDGFVSGGFGANEIGGSSGSYIDFKEDLANDYDLRIINWAGGAADIILRQANNLRFFTANTDRWRITAAGHFRPSADNTYDIGGSGLRVREIFAVNPVINTSDIRFKEEVQTIEYGLEVLKKLNPVSYKWKESDDKSVHLGFIAQELKSLVPEVVVIGDDPDERLGVRYSELIPVLVKAIQEQQEQIDVLTRKNNQLSSVEKEVEELKAELDKIRSYLFSEAKKQ